jgi:two-component system NtrC family response regulator
MKWRRLRNLLERALILSQHPELQLEDFHLQTSAALTRSPDDELTVEQLAALLPKRLDLREVMARFERSLLERALEMTNGVQAEAARHLEISRSDLGYKVTKYALVATPRANAD